MDPALVAGSPSTACRGSLDDRAHQRHRAPERPSKATRFAWFGAMVGGWVVFYVLMAASDPTLGDLRDRVRDLPLVLEGLVWLVFFPYVLALAIWRSGWSDTVRFALVTCCALGWPLAFYPWRRGPSPR